MDKRTRDLINEVRMVKRAATLAYEQSRDLGRACFTQDDHSQLIAIKADLTAAVLKLKAFEYLLTQKEESR